MRSPGHSAAQFVVGFLWAASAALPLLPAAIGTAPTDADQLVAEALQAELAGDAKLRSEKLAEALHVDPNHRAARWHSGFVQLDGQWVAISDVPAHTKNNARLAAYRRQQRTA